MITIIYRDSLLSVSEKYQFEEQLSLEMRFCIEPDGRIIECNKKGQLLFDQFGPNFLRFFTEQIAGEAKVTPELLREAPHHAPVKRLDEVKAARELVLCCWTPNPEDE